MAAKLKTQASRPLEVWAIAESVWSAEQAAVRQLGKIIDPEVFARCVDAIAKCRGRVLTTGCGTSAAAARKIAHSLCCIERPAAFLAPGDALHGGLGLVRPTDVVVVISKGGGTQEIVNLLPALKTKRALIIGVTENPDSSVARAANLFLRVKVPREPDPFNMLATASTMAVIAVFDAICIAVMQVIGYTREEFAVIHPGGAVGRRLHAGDPVKKKEPRRDTR